MEIHPKQTRQPWSHAHACAHLQSVLGACLRAAACPASPCVCMALRASSGCWHGQQQLTASTRLHGVPFPSLGVRWHGEAVGIYLLSCHGSAVLLRMDTAWVGSGSTVGNSTINLFPAWRACVSSDMAGPLSSFQKAALGVESCCVAGTVSSLSLPRTERFQSCAHEGRGHFSEGYACRAWS